MSDSEKKWNPIRLPANFDSVKFMDYACDFDFRRFLLALKTPIPAMLLTCIPSLIKNSLQIESSYLVFSVNKLNLYFWVSIDVSENIRLRPAFIAHYLILLNKLTRVHLLFRSLDELINEWVGSNKDFLNPASRRYFWSHPAISSQLTISSQSCY